MKLYTEELAAILTEKLLENDKLINNNLESKIQTVADNQSTITITRTQKDNGVVITITDSNGTSSTTLYDGKGVQVAKIEPIIGGNRVTFSYNSDDGTSQSSAMEVMNGENGVSIVNAQVTTNNVLMLELSDGSTINAGQIIANSDTLTLDNYYTIEQTDEKFVQKLELDTLIDKYLDSNLIPIESEKIYKLF